MKEINRRMESSSLSTSGEKRNCLDEIASIRKEIDALDKNISRMLAARLSHANRLAYLKGRLGVSIADYSREAAVLANVEQSCPDPELAEPVKRIYEAIMSQSRRLQSSVRSGWDRLTKPA